METVGVEAGSDCGGSSLPRFLKPVQSTQSTATQDSVPVHAVYTHKRPFGDAHVLWWPPRGPQVCGSSNKTVPTSRTILLFIPGTWCWLFGTTVDVAHTLVPGRMRTNFFFLPSPPIRARVLFHSLRKPRITRILCAISKRDPSRRQSGPIVIIAIVITAIVITAIVITAIVIAIQRHLRDDLRTLPSRLVVLHPAR